MRLFYIILFGFALNTFVEQLPTSSDIPLTELTEEEIQEEIKMHIKTQQAEIDSIIHKTNQDNLLTLQENRLFLVGE